MADLTTDQKRQIAVSAAFTLLLSAMVLAVVIGIQTTAHNSGDGEDDSHGGHNINAGKKAISSICHPTIYQEVCVETLSSASDNVTQPKDFIKVAFQAAKREIASAMAKSTVVTIDPDDNRGAQAMEICRDLGLDSVKDLKKSVVSITKFGEVKDMKQFVEDIRVWTSGAMTYQQVCLDSFENATSLDTKDKVQALLNLSEELTANALSIVTEAQSILAQFNLSALLDPHSFASSHGDHGSSAGDHGSSAASHGDHGSSDSSHDAHDSSDSSHDGHDSPDAAADAHHGSSDATPSDHKSADATEDHDSSNAATDHESPSTPSQHKRRRLFSAQSLEPSPHDAQPSAPQPHDALPSAPSPHDALPSAPLPHDALPSAPLPPAAHSPAGSPQDAHSLAPSPGPSPQKNLPPQAGEIPNWVNDVRRNIMTLPVSQIKPDVVVAADGSGAVKTIRDALLRVPKKNFAAFIIYIKEGIYHEHVLVDKRKTNIILVGDGPTKTRVSDSKNFVDGWQTSNTATIDVFGDGFMARDIGFENTAGPTKEKAVAARVVSDYSIFYNCNFDAYQDTLYAVRSRQFYRDCTISGTIDFIHGNALAYFQNCKIVIRKPLDGQQCVVTAQGRMVPDSPGAIIMQNCTITGAPDYLPVKSTSKAYLGSPWKKYSRTIVMESQIDDVIAPEGWVERYGDYGIKTLFYAEFSNRGPGADQSKRVNWPGIKKITATEAEEFTLKKYFANAEKWIKPTGCPYYLDLGPMATAPSLAPSMAPSEHH